MRIRAHPVLQEILSQEGTTDDRRIPGVVSPRSLFPEPMLYIACVRAASEKPASVDAAALWANWYSPGEWSASARPTAGTKQPTWPAPDPRTALALFPRAKHSEAVGYLGRELAGCGFNPRWAEDAARVLKIACCQNTLRQVLAAVDQTILEISVAYLRGRGLYEIQESLGPLLLKPAVPGNGRPSPSNCFLTSWMQESLQQDEINFLDFVPSKGKGKRAIAEGAPITQGTDSGRHEQSLV